MVNEDISKKTIIVLVILTLVISLLGTWTVLNEVKNIRKTTEDKSSAQGNVKLTILPNEITKSQEQTSATGAVAALEIIKSE